LRFGAIAVAAFLLVIGFEGHLLLSTVTDYSNALAGRIVVSICARSYFCLERRVFVGRSGSIVAAS